MNKAISIIILSFFSIAIISCSFKHRKVNYDIVYLYQPQKTLIQAKTLDQSDSVSIYLSLYNPSLYRTIKETEYFKNFVLYYQISSDGFESTNIMKDSLNTSNTYVLKSNETFYLTFKISKTEPLPDKCFLILYQSDIKKNNTEVTGLPLTLESNRFILFNKTKGNPIVDNYINTNDSVFLVSGKRKTNKIFISYFSNNFTSATPPHKVTHVDEAASLKRDSIYETFTNTSLNITREGLYFIQDDTVSNKSISFLLKKNPYPKISTVKDMIGPLAYITNTSDFRKIEGAEDPKSTLDSFWLSIGGSKDYSRALIKAYYEKVEYANKVFTSYKEGWKTDRGMVYIVLGKPDQVYRYKDSEEWVYENILTHIVSFTFVNTKNNLSSDYKLVRNPKYEKYWFSGIEKWRNGIIIK